ncbi:MAG: hypothetical protein Q4C58_14150 [Eubacteriales bacterium]|nr:hypothetical protein [Eubacteriales bacterium]
MATYSRKFGSQFPDKVMELHNYQNITTDLYPVVEQYHKYCETFDLDAARLLLTEYPELKQCMIDANSFNLLDEERYNTQIYALKSGQIIDAGESEPEDPDNQLVWIGGE